MPPPAHRETAEIVDAVRPTVAFSSAGPTGGTPQERGAQRGLGCAAGGASAAAPDEQQSRSMPQRSTGFVEAVPPRSVTSNAGTLTG